MNLIGGVLWVLLQTLLVILECDGKSPLSLTLKSKRDCGEFSLKDYSEVDMYYETKDFFECNFIIEEAESDYPKTCVVVEEFHVNDCSVAVEIYKFQPEYSFSGPDEKYACSSTNKTLEEFCSHLTWLYIQFKRDSPSVSEELKRIRLKVFSKKLEPASPPPEDDDWKQWATIGGLVGGFFVLLIVIVIYYCWCQDTICKTANNQNANKVPPEELEELEELEDYPLDYNNRTQVMPGFQPQPLPQGFQQPPPPYPSSQYGFQEEPQQRYTYWSATIPSASSQNAP